LDSRVSELPQNAVFILFIIMRIFDKMGMILLLEALQAGDNIY